LKRSNRLVLLIGIFLAIVAFVLIVLLLGNGGGGGGVRPSASPTTGNIVVATEDIALGEVIKEGQVGLQEVELSTKPADSYDLTAEVVGQVARASVTKGQLITTSTLGSSGSGSVVNIETPPGKVAMSVKVDQVSGVGTVIKPGDFVDAVVAFNIVPTVLNPDTGKPEAIGVDAGPSVKALLQGMQVLGTLLPAPTATQEPAPSGSPVAANGSTTLNGQEQIVILAVDLQQAEVLNYSQIKGLTPPNGITLVLRSGQDFVDAAGDPITPQDTLTTGVILSILVSQYGVLPPDFDTTLVTATPRPSPSPIASPSPSGSPSPTPVP
jgi:pilus assembly protein CpaB